MPCAPPGDVVALAERSRAKVPFQVAATGAHAPEGPPDYLHVNHADLTAQLLLAPERQEIPVVCEEQLIVEHYSR